MEVHIRLIKDEKSHFLEKKTFSFRSSLSSGFDTEFTFNQVNQRAVSFSAGLRALGVKRAENVGICSKNRLEWIIVEQGMSEIFHSSKVFSAANMNAQPTVAIYDTFGPEATNYIINHADMPVLICSTWKELSSKFISALDIAPTPQLKFIIQMQPKSEIPSEEWQEKKQFFEKKNVTFYDMDEVENLSRGDALHPYHKATEESEDTSKALQYVAPYEPPKPTELAVIMYTSGTTGMPKGVMMTHEAMMTSAAAGEPTIGVMNNEDYYLSYLPLAHIIERIVMIILISGGANIGKRFLLCGRNFQ
jgi:long-chain acyl-CoA synthetase